MEIGARKDLNIIYAKEKYNAVFRPQKRSFQIKCLIVYSRNVEDLWLNAKWSYHFGIREVRR